MVSQLGSKWSKGNPECKIYGFLTFIQCAFPVRVWFLMGVRRLVTTAAAGGLSPDFKVGDLMVLEDHIGFPGLSGLNPLSGPNDDRFGPRFIPLDDAYSPELRRLAKRVCHPIFIGPFL